MKTAMRAAAAAVVLLWAGAARAQTADEAVEKVLTAMGGRAALAKLNSRIASGAITVSTQGMDIGGTVEMTFEAPNKARTLMKLDLSPLGGAEMVIDQRCDGKTAFEMNTQTGDRELTGDQLQNKLNASFPTPFLKYKELGGRVEVAGREKLGDTDAIVLVYTPKTGPAARLYFDAQTWLLLKTVGRLNLPDAGGEVEQTTAPSDYRDVDGVKVPFTVVVTGPGQSVTIRLQKVEHNKPIDESLFARVVK